jgi:hypothetical protein
MLSGGVAADQTNTTALAKTPGLFAFKGMLWRLAPSLPSWAFPP